MSWLLATLASLLCLGALAGWAWHLGRAKRRTQQAGSSLFPHSNSSQQAEGKQTERDVTIPQPPSPPRFLFYRARGPRPNSQQEAASRIGMAVQLAAARAAAAGAAGDTAAAGSIQVMQFRQMRQDKWVAKVLAPGPIASLLLAHSGQLQLASITVRCWDTRLEAEAAARRRRFAAARAAAAEVVAAANRDAAARSAAAAADSAAQWAQQQEAAFWGPSPGFHPFAFPAAPFTAYHVAPIAAYQSAPHAHSTDPIPAAATPTTCPAAHHPPATTPASVAAAAFLAGLQQPGTPSTPAAAPQSVPSSPRSAASPEPAFPPTQEDLSLVRAVRGHRQYRGKVYHRVSWRDSFVAEEQLTPETRAEYWEQQGGRPADLPPFTPLPQRSKGKGGAKAQRRRQPAPAAPEPVVAAAAAAMAATPAGGRGRTRLATSRLRAQQAGSSQ